MRAAARELTAVFAGGAIGAVARAETAQALPAAAGSWPWATFLVNCAGAALLGYLAVRLGDRPSPSAYRRPLLTTGFCGGLTTFSTMQIELLRMLDRGRVPVALSYAAASIACGMVGVLLGARLGRHGGALA